MISVGGIFMAGKVKSMRAAVSAVAFAAALVAGSAAHAATFTINAIDSVYGVFHGTTSCDVNAPSSFTWNSAGYFWVGNIALTSGGNVIADIVSSDDSYTLFTGDSTIGLPSTASAAIEMVYGQTVSLYSTINDLNGGSGICCDNNGYTPQITWGPAAPAPLAGTGLLSAFAALMALAMTRFGRRAGTFG